MALQPKDVIQNVNWTQLEECVDNIIRQTAKNSAELSFTMGANILKQFGFFWGRHADELKGRYYGWEVSINTTGAYGGYLQFKAKAIEEHQEGEVVLRQV